MVQLRRNIPKGCGDSHMSKNYDRLVATLVQSGSPLLGAAVLPSVPDPAPAAGKKNTMCERAARRTRGRPPHARPLHFLTANAPRRYAQKGLSLRAAEAAALVDAMMHGRLHRDYVYVNGIQCAPHRCVPDPGRELPILRARADIVTTVVENGYYGHCTGTTAAGGLVILKAGNLLVLAVYTAPSCAAQAVPYVHRFAQGVGGS